MGLMDEMREVMRRKQYAAQTEKTYVHWVERYIRYHGMRHPREMGAGEVQAFLTHLSVEGEVAAATQNQALNAIVFLYREVLGLAVVGVMRKERVAFRHFTSDAVICSIRRSKSLQKSGMRTQRKSGSLVKFCTLQPMVRIS